MRPDGFYWVKQHYLDDWTVAEFRDGDVWLVGWDASLLESWVEVWGPRIDPPAAVTA